MMIHEQGALNKILSLEDLPSLRKQAWESEARLVSTNGCFDLLHAGHTRFLEQARQLGEMLVVGLNSDASVRAVKGPDRPYVSQGERAEVLAALACVDYVVVFDDLLPTSFLELLKPDFHVKGGDYQPDSMPETETVRRSGGQVVILPLVGGFSTSRLTERIAGYAPASAVASETPATTAFDHALRYLLDGANLRRRAAYQLAETVVTAAHRSTDAIQSGHKLLFCGNGGSAADAQHIAAEFTGRFLFDRAPLPALALSTDTSALTSIGNDYGFEQVFARQVEALAVAGDLLFALSTSGNSPNVLAAAQSAKQKDVTVIALTGEDGGQLKQYADVCFQVPTLSVPFIQEMHIALLHAIVALTEQAVVRPGS